MQASVVRASIVLAVSLAAGCFDPETSDNATGTGSTSGSGSTTVEPTASSSDPGSTGAPTSDDNTSTNATTTAADSSTSPDDSSSGDDPTETTGGTPATICDQAPTTLAACGTSKDGAATYGALACDNTVMDFSVFYEDVYAIELTAGQCFYARVDNIGMDGATGANAADVALQLRSPSGAYAWLDDDIACTDPAWTGGACPQVQLTADVGGTWELAIVQASGKSCVTGAAYSLYAAVDGAALMPGMPIAEDVLVDCTP